MRNGGRAILPFVSFSRKTPFLIAIAVFVTVAIVHSGVPSLMLSGSLLTDANIAVNLKARADADHDQELSPREIRSVLTAIVRGVAIGRMSEDVNGDGAVTKADVSSAVRVFRALLGSRCGNSIVDLLEQCDDGNVVAGDGCSAQCTNEPRHLACVEFACTPVLGDGPNTCSTQNDCAPTYGLSAEIPVSATLPVSPSHETSFDVSVMAAELCTNMVADLEIPFYPFQLETWQPDSRCTETHISDTISLSCPIPSIDPQSGLRFGFAIQPEYFPNCNAMTPTVSVRVTLREDRAYNGQEPPPHTYTLTMPLQCLSSADVVNRRVADPTPVSIAECGDAKLGDGSSNFYFPATWFDQQGTSHIFAMLTGNAAGHFVFDDAGQTITMEVFGAGGRNFIRDAVYDPDHGVAYLFVQRFDPTTNASLGEQIVTYDPQTNTEITSIPFSNAGGYYGMASTSLRRPVIQNGKAYFFPVYAFNGQPIHYINAYDPVIGVVTEVARSTNPAVNPLDLTPYAAASQDRYTSQWKSCFLRRAKVPLQ